MEKEGTWTGGSSGGSAGSLKPTKEEINNAATTIAWALETIGITKYGLIGGGALSILGSQYNLRTQQTDDLNLIIQLTTSMSADLVSRSLINNKNCERVFFCFQERKLH